MALTLRAHTPFSCLSPPGMQNLLLTVEGHVKITDFGFAKRLGKGGGDALPTAPDLTFTLCGTPEYLAPEIIQCRGHGLAVDWWTLGVLLYEMLAGRTPHSNDDPFTVYRGILSGELEFPRRTRGGGGGGVAGSIRRPRASAAVS